MTGKDLIKWIQENHAEEYTVMGSFEVVGEATTIYPHLARASVIDAGNEMYSFELQPFVKEFNAIVF